ncbi:hypothetical protein QMK19_23445 [Streptomyces sp. H10-C2]|uniref:hypothetical protein n=1 Tax=unclassified Streptomyces TaxID=2593676 RepID=UPI0024B92F37|nr:MULTISPECIES: hypothetical protein [unclassified Streptomyces]MDJ0342751.1 hypothetical protein [Streptomyces sp. PH10-H1]MDJ0372539.1 hypothetical protein [Streptomyces sp. H10-C2]
MVCGYRLVLPPGWGRIPLREGTEDAIRVIVREAFDGSRGDRVAQVRVRLEGRLQELAVRARRDGAGLDLYLPVRPRGAAAPVPASFVMSELALEGRKERREYVAGESRRVDYVLPVPDAPGRCLAAAFSTPTATADHQLADVMVELFDAVMGTFRWSEPDDADPTHRPSG